MKRRRVTYFVDSPWTDRANGKSYPLTKIEVEELKHKTITKTGKMGRAVVVRIHCYNGSVVTDHAVCCPPDTFDFLKGAKIAMERALNQTRITKPLRKSIWDGLFASYHQHQPSLKELDRIARKRYNCKNPMLIDRVRAYRHIFPEARLTEAVKKVKELS